MQNKSAAKSPLLFVWLAVLAVLLPLVATPVSAAPAKGKATRVMRPVLPSPEKDAAIIVDGATGKILYSRNPDAPRYPASLTKMMTLYMLFDALEKDTISLDTKMVASAYAAGQSPTKLSVRAGRSITVDTAIKAIAVLSANDVAVMVAETLGGGSESAFAAMMTEKAHQLGMTSTTFHNASGLPNLQQITTARDMAILGRHLAYDFPQFYHYFTTRSFTYNKVTYRTHNNLIAAFEGTDGIKTGYTRLSGFNLVTSAVRENKHVVGVVMGGPTAAVRDREMMRLLSAAFDAGSENPTILADANVPWNGGQGPGGDLFAASAGEYDVLTAYLDRKMLRTKGGAQTVIASAKPAPNTLQLATIEPLLGPAPSSPRPFALPSQKPAPLNLGQTSALLSPSSSIPVAQGDGAEPPTFAPGQTLSATAKEWAVQIGAFASATLAASKLAAFAKRSVDIFGQAEMQVVPVTAGGKTLYRARFGMFAEDEARSICARIARRGQSCVAIPQA